MAKKKRAAAPSSATRNAPQLVNYDADIVRSYARGRWVDILSIVGGIPSQLLDGKHHPCPKPGCSATTDGFRFTNMDGDGSILCNQCCRHDAGNGFKALEWILGVKFFEVVRLVAEYLGVPPSNGSANYKANGKHDADPAENLEFWQWEESNELLAATWCVCWKRPVVVAAIKACHGQVGRYRGRHTVIALPVWGEQLTAANPIGWTLYNSGGGTLPSYSKDKDGNWIEKQEKILTTFGSKAGLIGPVERLAEATEVWKLEGPSDLLAFYSLAGIPQHVMAVTNSHGAGERPHKWMIEKFAGKSAVVLHDSDAPGQNGSVGYRDKRGKWHPGWCGYLRGTAASVELAKLPFTVEEKHGKDLRDFLLEKQNGASN